MHSLDQQPVAMPPDPAVEVSHPIGERWPVISFAGISGSIRLRRDFEEGMRGALDHWRSMARALQAVDGLPLEYRQWAAAATKASEPVPAPRPLPGRIRERLIATLAHDPDFAEAIRTIIGGAA